MGNGIANIIASLIIAGAIVGSNFIDNRGSDNGQIVPDNEKEFNEWLARAVGDIRNDVVVNCGCCGEGQGKSFTQRVGKLDPKSGATPKPF